MVTEVGTTTITSAQALTGTYALAENQLVPLVNAAGGAKWLALYGETQTTLEISYTTGTAETSNYVEFYIEYGSGAPANIDWAAETMEYFDDVNNQIILEEYTYKLDGAAAGTEYTKRIQLPACTKGIRIYVKEVGVAANFGTLTIKANTQAAGASNYNRSLQTVTTAVGSKMIITDGTDDAAVLARTTGTEQPANTDNALVVYDVGGGASSVAAEYIASTGGLDGTVVYTSGTTLTVSGTSFTITSELIRYVIEIDESGNTAQTLVNGSAGVQMEISSGVVTVAGGTAFTSGSRYVLGYDGQKKGYNAASDADQQLLLNSDSQNFASAANSASSQGDGTTSYYFTINGWKNGFSVQIEDTPGAAGTNTYTVEASNQDDGTADASKVYQDVTQYGMANMVGAAAANYTADVFLKNADRFVPVTVKVNVVRSADGGGTDGAWDILFKKL